MIPSQSHMYNTMMYNDGICDEIMYIMCVIQFAMKV